MKKLFVTIALALTLSGCSLFPSNWGKKKVLFGVMHVI
ncbi:lipoprotein [Vibrio fluvialis]